MQNPKKNQSQNKTKHIHNYRRVLAEEERKKFEYDNNTLEGLLTGAERAAAASTASHKKHDQRKHDAEEHKYKSSHSGALGLSGLGPLHTHSIPSHGSGNTYGTGQTHPHTYGNHHTGDGKDVDSFVGRKQELIWTVSTSLLVSPHGMYHVRGHEGIEGSQGGDGAMGPQRVVRLSATGLDEEQMYWWRVRERNEKGWGDWSAMFSHC